MLLRSSRDLDATSEPFGVQRQVDVRDRGVIADPLVGRRRPDLETDGGRGLWLAHQICDFVQVASGPGGTAVRVHVHLR